MKKIISTLMALAIGLSQMFAAYTHPETGKVYRIHNVKYQKVIGENAIARQVTSANASGDDDFSQLWMVQKSGNGYLLQNAYSGQYLSHCLQQSTLAYPTSDVPATMFLTKMAETKYAIGQGERAYLHLDTGDQIVRWWDANTEPSQWQFEEVSVSKESISLQQAAFKTFYEEYLVRLELIEHQDEYNELLPTFFADTACTELREDYAAMSDEELRAAMSELPKPLQDMALKIKNNAWGHREKEFRIRNYKAYSNPDYWGEVLYTKKYSRINNPTGIYGNAGDVLYIFVDNDAPAGTTLQAEIISGSAVQGTAYTLKKGLNMIPTIKNYTNLFIQYVGETSLESDVLITDYPELKIHIEQGVVNGFWNKEEHDDEDWKDMMTNLATGDMFQVKGERIMFHMSKYYMKMYCPNTISDAIGWWDDMTRWQQDMLGIEDVRLTKFNNLGCAISLTTGYQSATHYRTQYLDSYIVNLLPYENMMTNADNCWGPAHENGHVHQAAIQSVGTSEVSNNFFSNLTLFKLGKFISRGRENDLIFTDYGNHVPYIVRDGASTMRMFWQLYLYFHEVKGDSTFYPRVIQAMRATPMKARDPKYYANYVFGNEDLLLFAKACCDAAQMDLSEFFRFWGYLEITDKQHVGDYGDYYLTTRESDVEEFLAHASQYPKAPSIIFIEDRVKEEPRTDGGSGYKIYHYNAVPVGQQAGDVGHYTDFKNTDVKAEGYTYERQNTSITISGGTGAVGFKVYDKTNGALLYGSNRLKFSIPQEYAMYDIAVVAAQADGTDVPVMNISETGTESQQLAFLEEMLTLAKEYVEAVDTTDTKIGYFKVEYLIELNETIDKVQLVIKNSDQSEQTYGKWAAQLYSTVSALHRNPDARVSITSNSIYSLAIINIGRYMGVNTSYELNITENTSEETPESMQWKFIETEKDGTYYIQHRATGKYITALSKGERVKAESNNIEDAVAFEFIPDAPGEFYIQSAIEDDLRLHSYQNSKVNAGDQKTNNAKWNIYLEDNLLALPDVSTNELLTAYYLVREENGEQAYSYISKMSADNGRITIKMNNNIEDFNHLFYFKQGSQEGKYTIYSCGTGKPVTINNGELYINKETEGIPEFAITLNEQGTGFVISSEEGDWDIQRASTLDAVTLSSERGLVWKLQRVRTFVPTLTSITLVNDKNEEPITEATLLEGETITLIANTAPAFATGHSITWSSSDNNVAVVNNGKIEAIATGNAIITAIGITSNGNEVKATCSIVVKKNLLTRVSVTPSRVTLTEGETTTLTVRTLPTTAADHSVTWSSSNENVATVEPTTGKVTAIAAGNVTITATANDGSGCSATCQVTVEPKAETGITSATTGLEILCDGDAITIVGLTEGTLVNVYNTIGKQIATATATSSAMTINTGLAKGSTAIVIVGTHNIKVQIR